MTSRAAFALIAWCAICIGACSDTSSGGGPRDSGGPDARPEDSGAADVAVQFDGSSGVPDSASDGPETADTGATEIDSGPTDGGPDGGAGPWDGGDVSGDGGDVDAGAPDGGQPPWKFALGVEYTEHGLAPAYGATGVTWTKTHLEEFSWSAIEPDPPVNGAHTYDWTCPDDTIREFQKAGIIDIQSYLHPRSCWGSVTVDCTKPIKEDIMPQAAFMADYRAWATALFERYDGDGTDDMPGLLAPVRYWVIGAEWTGFWPSGNADDYIALLEITRDAARAASPDIMIGLIPFFLSDVFQGNVPTPQQIEDRLKDPPPKIRNSTAGMMKILDRPDLFDYVDMHSLGDYTELPPMLAWMRDQMAGRGYAKPIWLDDAFPISFLANWHPSPDIGLPAMYPVTEAQYQDVYNLLVDVAKLTEPAYTPAMKWIRAETASGAVKKVVTAAGEGAAGIQLGNTEDWMDDAVGGTRHFTVNFIGAAAMMGMLDVTHNGYGGCDVRTPGAKRPAFRNLEILVEKIVGFDAVDKPAGLGAGVWAYRFSKRGQTVTAIWHEDDVLQLPGETETPVEVQLPLAGASSARVTRAVTDVDAQGPEVATLPVTNGTVTLTLTSVPVFVEPLP